MVVQSFGFDKPGLQSILTIAAQYNGNGFYLRSDDYLNKIPMYLASCYIYIIKDWKYKNQIMKSADGYLEYFNDLNDHQMKQYLLKGLLFICLSQYPHMISQHITIHNQSYYYNNELCLDTTNGETIASIALKQLKLTDKEITLLGLWNDVIKQAKTTKNYNPELTYGIFQITKQLNTFTKKIINKSGKEEKVYDYPELDSNLKSLDTNLKQYYLDNLIENLFKYKFLQ